MALRDLLNLESVVSVIRTIQENDGMGGFSSTTQTTVLPYSAIWQNSSDDKWLSDEIMKNSSHTLVLEHGVYTFYDSTGMTSIQNVMESVTYNSVSYSIVGHPDDVMNLGEIDVVGLQRIG